MLNWKKVCLVPMLSVCAALGQAPAPSGNLVIFHAGSLTPAFSSMEAAFQAENPGVVIVDKSGSGVDLARRVTAGGELADVFATADAETIDLMMKPKYAAYNIRFGKGAMVLVYRADDAKATGIAAGSFLPQATPAILPSLAPGWVDVLARPGVVIGGSDPRADPSGYRALLIMQLAEKFYRQPGLADSLKKNYVFPAPASAAFRFVYEASALQMARKDPAVRIARLPAEINLGDPGLDRWYAQATVILPGLRPADPPVVFHGESVTWCVTVLRSARNEANAVAFLRYLLTPSKGVAIQNRTGPQPITPGLVQAADLPALPVALRSMVVVR